MCCFGISLISNVCDGNRSLKLESQQIGEWAVECVELVGLAFVGLKVIGRFVEGV